ncbi:hypothetical protein D3C71_1179530 [compost metagenome]
MQRIAGKPAQGKRRGVGAAQNNGTGPQEVVDHRAVRCRDQVFLQLDPVGGGVARLIDVDLDRDGYAGQDAGIFAARKLRVHGGSPSHDLVRTMVHDRIQRGIHGVEPLQRALRGLDGGHFTVTDTGGKFNCGQTP